MNMMMNHQQRKSGQPFHEGRLTIVHIICSAFFLVAFTGCDQQTPNDLFEANESLPTSHRQETQPLDHLEDTTEPVHNPSPPIVAAARGQVGTTLVYDPAYVGLSYPGGDVPIERGVCTDVVIRALREAYDIDLQRLVHEDMKHNFSAYPTIWGLTRTDKNIDHRRVPNLRRYFERHGNEVSRRSTEYLPGDLITCTVGNRPHIMVISDRISPSGSPLVIHNIGRGTVEEDRLNAFTITGHYRIQPPEPVGH